VGAGDGSARGKDPESHREQNVETIFWIKIGFIVVEKTALAFEGRREELGLFILG